MDLYTFYAVQRHGAAALPGASGLDHPGTRGYERASVRARMLHDAHERRRLARLERRSRRLRARLRAVEAQLAPSVPPLTAGC